MSTMGALLGAKKTVSLLVMSLSLLLIQGSTASADEGAKGWLGDGSAVFEVGPPPQGWSASNPGGWSTKMPAWSNASPIVVGERIFVTAEPLSLICVSLQSGKILWKHELSYLDTVGPKERAKVAQERAEAKALTKTLRAKERELNKLKRSMRKARGSKDAAARSQAILAEIGPLKTKLDQYAHLRAPEPIDVMGTAPSTPISDGRHVYALMGNGVVASFTLDGKMRWAKHLGRPAQRMRGFHKGQAASPLIVEGVLVVALNHLRGLDLKTGEERWRRPEAYLDFGPPRATTIDGVALLITPMGEVIRASDGVLLMRIPDANVYFVSPLSAGRKVYFVGATKDPDLQERSAIAIELVGPPDALRASPLWRLNLPREKTYATPLLHQGLIYALGIRGSLVLLDAEQGRVIYEEVLDLGHGDVMPSPILSGGQVVIMGGSGHVALVRAGRRFELLYSAQLGDARATPTLIKDQLIIRDLERLWSLKTPR